MCGRRKMEREHPDLCDWGDMPIDMVEAISEQVPVGIVVQFHNNGDPLMYPELGRALGLFQDNIRCLNTNGKLLVERADDIIDNLDTITISIIQDDPEENEQYETIKEFLAIKGSSRPLLVYRLLGDVFSGPYDDLPGIVVRRILHSPEGSFDYQKAVTKPEIGICLDILTHLAIDRYGNVSPCVRFDPHRVGIIGDVSHETLQEIWYGHIRWDMIQNHLAGRRDRITLCSTCDYWGVATS
uniref:Putative iron-sulfur cluster-binding domain contining protein n=1 Tax=viral metagenome TaxID=1070528 RepID=A0A6M3IES0_9ZZZZ